MSDDEVAQVLARVKALMDEARDDYAKRGIPQEEVSQDDLLRYAYDRSTEHERVVLGMPPDEERRDEFGFAQYIYRKQVLADQGKLPAEYVNLLLGIDDPVKAERIRFLIQRLREQDQERTYWGVDEDGDDSGNAGGE